jgi:hypothetical protein
LRPETASEKPIIEQIEDKAQLEERFTSDRQVLNWNPRDGVREENLKDMEENGRRREWEPWPETKFAGSMSS